MRNVEAKFPLPDIAAARRRAEAMGFEYISTLVQHDTFFMVSNGKLKLREETDGACLIHYQRHREKGLELSNYQIVPVSETLKLRELLSVALGVLGEVDKQRILLRRTNVRLHLDEVVNYGAFGELEAVVNAEADLANCHIEVATILAGLRIPFDQLIDVSYFELPR
jgi:predicted adenylyl cyclase CyaB